MAKVQIVPGKDKTQANCICKYNVDVSSGGCPIALKSDGTFDKALECTYCYSKYLHKNTVLPKDVDERIWEKQVEAGMEVNVIRIGKHLEPGHKSHREALYRVLELNNEYNIKSILITKMLEFDEKVAELLRSSDSTTHYSMGNEHMERGAVLNGCTNKWRLKTAQKYKDAGVNTYLRVVEDITIPMRSEVKLWAASGIPLLITPLRYTSKAVLNQYRPDANWDELREGNTYSYYKGALKPLIWHKDYAQYKERCGEVANVQHCNNCGLKNLKKTRRILNGSEEAA